MTTSYALILTAAAVAMFYGVLMFPRWFAQSMVRHAMWRLRDDVFDSMISGELPSENGSVRAWSEFFDGIARSPAPHLLEVVAITRIKRNSPDIRVSENLPMPGSFVGLDEAQAHRLEGFVEHARFLCFSSMLLGSWVGIVSVALFAVRRLVTSLIRRGTHSDLRKIVAAGVTDAVRRGGLEHKYEHSAMRVAAR